MSKSKNPQSRWHSTFNLKLFFPPVLPVCRSVALQQLHRLRDRRDILTIFKMGKHFKTQNLCFQVYSKKIKSKKTGKQKSLFTCFDFVMM